MKLRFMGVDVVAQLPPGAEARRQARTQRRSRSALSTGVPRIDRVLGDDSGDDEWLSRSNGAYCLRGTSGRTRSTKNAATFAMRLPQQLGQMLRPWHEKATRRSWPQASHQTLEKPS